MIEKILDNYYDKKLIKKIEDTIKFRYLLDFKIEKKDEYIILSAKPYKYKNYTKIFIFGKRNSLENLIIFKEIKEQLCETIDNINKNNEWE